jgi:prephenate dehydratase
VAVAREGIPAPTGHDRTSLVCFQNDDHPGSLHEILGHFTARSINLTKIESRPTRTGLGDYCFIIDCEGHIEDEVVGDCLRELHASLPAVKFLGSYPAGGAGALARRAEATARQKAAGAWLEGLRRQIRPHRTS